MKNNLENARETINEVDREMIVLFKKRMNAAKQVALYKEENNLPIFDESREIELINKNVNLLNDKEIEEFYLTFLNGILVSSKDYQKKLLKK